MNKWREWWEDNKDKEFVIKADDLAALLRLKHVVVGEAVYSTDAGVFTEIWGDKAALIYIPEDMEEAEGTTPHTIIVEQEGFPKVQTYSGKKVVDYEVTRKYVTKNLSTSYGYLISDTKA